MKRWLRNAAVPIVVCTLVPAGAKPAIAARPHTSGFGYSNSHLGVEVGLAAAGVGVAIGMGIYFGVHQNHRLTGCAATASNGLTLTTEVGQQPWILIGEVAGVKDGDRVRVTGKKQKEGAGPRQFLVERLIRDYGACRLQPRGQ